MFEQATLANGLAGKRVWTTLLGMTSQVALVSFAVLAPMVWPQVLPLAKLEISLAPLTPPGPRTLDETRRRPAQKPTTGTRTFVPLAQYQPTAVPDRVFPVDDVPSTPTVVGALPNGVGDPDGVPSALWRSLPVNAPRPATPHVDPTPAAKPVAEPAPVVPIRVRQGGRVQLGKVLNKGELVYPAGAKAARIQGVVELECVVGTDGRMREVKVKSGNPLLVKAAVEAAWQWVYTPTQLNGLPIEIVTILSFNFKLN